MNLKDIEKWTVSEVRRVRVRYLLEHISTYNLPDSVQKHGQIIKIGIRLIMSNYKDYLIKYSKSPLEMQGGKTIDA